MSGIKGTGTHRATGFRERVRIVSRTAPAIAGLLTFVLVALIAPAQASAGRSSTGKAAFYPCTRCHPVFVDAQDKPTRPLPNGFKKHEITLEVHDTLGTDAKACLACHDEPTRNPGKLILPDGSLVDITGDVSRVCQRCHSAKYRDWKAGIHGKRAPKCTSAGCHDPHTPSWIYLAALPPFLGTGIEIHAVGERAPFTALASAPVPPAVSTPLWIVIAASVGALAFAGGLSYLILGRSKR